MRGNLGRAIVKDSAVKAEHRRIEAPARVFSSQEDCLATAARGELDLDRVVVVRPQGPRANGMPELHGLTPTLANLQDAGRRVALVTDGRMSGASGKIPAAIHLSPKSAAGGPLACVRDGDIIRFDAKAGTLDVLLPEAEWAARPAAQADLSGKRHGKGRELFSSLRACAGSAEEGAASFVEHDQ